MGSDRTAALERMLRSRPDDARLRFGLALEYEKTGRREDAVRELRTYLDAGDDEGNAWGRLGALLRELGRDGDAKEAYRRGVEAASRHGHPTMAEDFEAVLDGWEP
ncbi:MAG TPA: tetratricopeptide repeat protein [Longimicrobiales bacterium]|nr:tetratricopeptide repeat protein [Longimicrobiales bacterium]